MMANKFVGRVLIVDDEATWRRNPQKFLERDGFVAHTAEDLDQALGMLANYPYHVAIVDIMLSEDGPLGMDLLHQLHQYHDLRDVVQVIVISGQDQEHSTVRRLLRDYRVSDFLSKKDAVSENFRSDLLDAVHHALAEVNTNLEILFVNTDSKSISDLLMQLRLDGSWLKPPSTNDDPHAESQRQEIQKLAMEMEDILRKIYPSDATQLEIVPLTGGHSGTRVARIRPRFDHHVGQWSLLKYGDRDLIQKEYNNYQDFVKHYLPTQRTPSLDSFVRTRKLGGIVYTFLGNRSNQDFTSYYEQHSIRDIEHILSQVFRSALGNWHVNRSVPEIKDLGRYYFSAHRLNERAISQHLERLPEYCRSESIQVPGYADPFWNPAYQGQKIIKSSELPVYTSIIHGDLNADNIIVDENEQPWLIDFLATSVGHSLQDFISLEADIKFRLLPKSTGIDDRLQLDRTLSNAFTFTEMQATDIESKNRDLVKCFAAIKTLRRLAGMVAFPTESLKEYEIGLFYTSLWTLGFYNLDTVQLIHALLSASILGTKLGFSKA